MKSYATMSEKHDSLQTTCFPQEGLFHKAKASLAYLSLTQVFAFLLGFPETFVLQADVASSSVALGSKGGCMAGRGKADFRRDPPRGGWSGKPASRPSGIPACTE